MIFLADKLNVVFPKKKYAVVATCKECNKTFVNRSNLSKHFKAKHLGMRLKFLRLCKRVIDFFLVETCEETSVYYCKKCTNTFNSKTELIKHIAAHEKQKNKNLKCAMCNYSSGEQKAALKHLEETHGFIPETETLTFASLDEFLAWKQEKERETSSLFTNSHGSYKTNDFVRFNYSCHRSGAVRRQGRGIRRIKASKKIDAYCPSRLEVIVRANECEVKFTKTHVGHETVRCEEN